MKEDKKLLDFKKNVLLHFDGLFSNSDFWGLHNYPKNYKEIKKFVLTIVEKTEENTKKYCSEEFDKFEKSINSKTN